MNKRRFDIESLLESDATPFLLIAGLSIGGIGWMYGLAIAVKVFAGLFVALLILAAVVLVWSGDNQERRRLEELQAIYGGKVARVWYRLGRRHYRFRHQHARVTIRLNYPPRESFRETYVHVDLIGPMTPIEMVILPHGVRALTKRMISTRVEIHDQTFEEDFDVFGAPAEEIRLRLSKEARSDVRAIHASGLIQIQATPRGISVVATDEKIGVVTQATLSLYDKFQAADHPAGH